MCQLREKAAERNNIMMDAGPLEGGHKPGRPSNFSPLILRSTATSSSVVIASPPVSIRLPAIASSPPGAMSPVPCL